MAQDHYSAPVSCPKCKQEGVLFLTEEDGWAYMRNQAVTVDSVKGEFEAIGQSSGSIKVKCLKCRSSFEMKP